MIGVDLFSGAGGMSYGAHEAGIRTSVAVESDVDASSTFAGNHLGSTVITKCISNVSSEEIFDKTKETPHIVFGGPPCQGFSYSNKINRSIENEKNTLFKHFIRVSTELRPDWIVFENVEGFSTLSNGSYVKELTNKLNICGYKSKWKILTASDYSVPQNRRRFFLVANKVGVDYIFPKPKSLTPITVRMAISDLPSLQNGEMSDELDYKCYPTNEYNMLMRHLSRKSTQNYVSRNSQTVLERYSHIPQGCNWKSIPEGLLSNYNNVKNIHSGIYKRLHPDLPSVVIANYRKNMLIHPFEDRGLSVREAARIQSFPDHFKFHGSLMSIQQQIGNAVPPLLAKSIFQSITDIQYGR